MALMKDKYNNSYKISAFNAFIDKSDALKITTWKLNKFNSTECTFSPYFGTGHKNDNNLKAKDQHECPTSESNSNDYKKPLVVVHSMSRQDRGLRKVCERNSKKDSARRVALFDRLIKQVQVANRASMSVACKQYPPLPTRTSLRKYTNPLEWRINKDNNYGPSSTRGSRGAQGVEDAKV